MRHTNAANRMRDAARQLEPVRDLLTELREQIAEAESLSPEQREARLGDIGDALVEALDGVLDAHRTLIGDDDRR